jgi:hypothetical protein
MIRLARLEVDRRVRCSGARTRDSKLTIALTALRLAASYGLLRKSRAPRPA